jgi:ABC-type multidrug transport system permease subunit
MAALSPSAEVAATFTTLFASFVITFNGVLQPLNALIPFWRWMYHLSPYTYLIGGLVANSISGTTVTCAQSELNTFNPPVGQTCQSFAGAFVEVSGKLLNPDATSACEYCRYSVGDQYLSTLNMNFDDRWRNFGFMCVYITFNAALCFAFFYLTKVASFNTMELAAKFSKKTKTTKSESPLTMEPEKAQHDSADDKGIQAV